MGSATNVLLVPRTVMENATPLKTAIVAVPETAGSALYGLLDVLSVTGQVWQTLMRSEPLPPPFHVQVVSERRRGFRCGNRIPVEPDAGIEDPADADIVILPELWLGPDEDLQGRYPALIEWIRARDEGGACVYSACSGALMLAETGLLDGCDATSHWGYQVSSGAATRTSASGPSRISASPMPRGASSPRAARPRGTTSRCTSSRAT
jgi:transcriptional regulator GlxA family with amidase domain